MVLVLDDHPIARQGLESIIKLHKPEEETLQAGTVGEAIDLVEHKHIDMAFVDLHLHNESGFEFLEWVQRHDKAIKTFVITSSSSESDFVKAKNLGIDAYVLKDAFIVCIASKLLTGEESSTHRIWLTIWEALRKKKKR